MLIFVLLLFGVCKMKDEKLVVGESSSEKFKSVICNKSSVSHTIDEPRVGGGGGRWGGRGGAI